MQKLTVTLVVAGLIGIVVSTLLTISSVGNLVTEVSETEDSFEESGEVIWEGRSPATFEGDLLAMSIYTVLIEDGRRVDVEPHGIVWRVKAKQEPLLLLADADRRFILPNKLTGEPIAMPAFGDSQNGDMLGQ